MIIIEIQHNFDGTTACISTTHASRPEAEQKYHTVLSFAAVSNVYIHSVVMLDADGNRVKGETYYHAEVTENV